MKKLTLRNQKEFFKKLKVGDVFEYSFSTFSFQCARHVARQAGFEIRLLAGTACEIIVDATEESANI